MLKPLLYLALSLACAGETVLAVLMGDYVAAMALLPLSLLCGVAALVSWAVAEHRRSSTRG